MGVRAPGAGWLRAPFLCPCPGGRRRRAAVRRTLKVLVALCRTARSVSVSLTDLLDGSRHSLFTTVDKIVHKYRGVGSSSSILYARPAWRAGDPQ